MLTIVQALCYELGMNKIEKTPHPQEKGVCGSVQQRLTPKTICEGGGPQEYIERKPALSVS